MSVGIQNTNPADLILAAVNSNTDLEKLEKLLELQLRWQANEARKEYALSFSNAQKAVTSVYKSKTNNQTKSKYADLGDVIESVKPVYTKEGFSVIFYEGDTVAQEMIRIYADVLHSSGHKETYHLDVPLDGKGLQGNANMTKIHGKASSVAYARRYLMCMIWNIPTSDNDGNTDVEVITEKQLSDILDLLAAKELSEKKLLEFLKIEALENLPAKDYMKALAAINSAKKKGA